ncbi:BREX system ATP-binding domain-containing protein [Methanosarcina sp. 2.H.A.1B.4]|uniref:BREX system ATP-binding domain-containing protein n=1 Tax=Methanosarcina sp. 2.H.A.1B.4 TaxID=1483600 RepID=UPI000621169E|nr:BREX system ATP-binding domain-containing protein [Methanosarcina sp. 2.H.A.1B.4]KKG12534.1 hypothetical protein EO92_01585 [Methanosarcina sp. 2.H.A.1B.4]
MEALEAERIIESLRRGIPPEGHVAEFTVGREEEINELKSILLSGSTNALLIKSNYGSGKTHLLKLTREMALSSGYAVSLITLDSKSGVRFNRIDQIFGQVCRQLEVPGRSGKSVRNLFDLVYSTCFNKNVPEKIKHEILELSNNGKWDYSRYLLSNALYVALRAWCFASPELQDRIEDWLFQPWEYKTRRKELYDSLVLGLRRKFYDPRSDVQFYKDNIFNFELLDYQQSWDALNDLDKLAKMAGLKGLILLIDEFEDVIHNLGNKNYQQKAFWNLFQFFGGKYNNLTFFAVTPDFAEKCKNLLLTKGVYDYDYSLFDELTAFRMSPLSGSQLFELSKNIVSAHIIAYRWSGKESVYSNLHAITVQSMQIPVQDRVRQTIKEVVCFLDDMVEDLDGE